MSKLRATVIGSGFGGLTAAIRLQAAGIETTVFEQRNGPGGRAYVYHDQGFTFDAGPTVITAPDCLAELFALAGRSLHDYVTLVPLNPFYRLFWQDGYRLDYGTRPHLEDQIAQKAPRDVLGYREFFDFTQEVFHEAYDRLAAVPFTHWTQMARVTPKLLRLKAYRSVYSTVSRFIHDTHLRQALSFHSLLVGGNPFTTSSIYILIHYLEQKWGVFFPKGGTGALVRALIRLLQELGGNVVLSCPVKRIVTRGNRAVGVRTATGTHGFDLIISNADVTYTYEKLLQDEPMAQATSRKLRRMHYGMSLFLIYIGAKSAFPELSTHNVMFGPRYRELLDDIFVRGRIADDFSLYVHAPSYVDSSLAPVGCQVYYVLSPVPHLGRLNVNWKDEGPRYAEKILAYLESFYMPGLRDSIMVQRVFTPADFQSELNAHVGAAFSLEPRLFQSAYFRVHNRDPYIRGLYFVGAGTHPGAGIPGVVNSAKATARLVFDDYGLDATSSSLKERPFSYA